MDINKMKSHEDIMACVEIVKEYEAKPQNRNGSIRWFLYRWDDGKDGVRFLVKDRENGEYYLIQSYRLYKTSEANNIYEDWYYVKDEKEADLINKKYTGLEWELKNKPFIRFKNGKLKKEE